MQRVLSFGFLLLLGFSAVAQDNKLNSDQVRAVAQTFGLDPDGRHAQSLATGHTYNPRGPADLKVIRHIKGQGGSKFQTSEDIANIDRPTEAELKQLGQQLDKAYLEQEKLLVIRSAPILPKCETSKTEIIGTAMTNDTVADADIIFLDPKDTPKDSKAIGKSTSIQAYITDKPDGGSLAAWAAGVICLPTRLRYFSKSRYTHTGIEAFKNYDSDLHGKGVLDPSLKYLESRF